MLKNLTVIFIIFFSSCNSLFNKNKVYEKKLRCVKVKEVFPFIDNNGKLYRYDTPVVKIYYHQDKIMYQLGYHFDSTSNGKHIMSEYRNHFFIYKKGNVFGYNYDKYKSIFGKKVLVDSMFKEHWVTANKQYPIFTQNKVTLISSNQNIDSGYLHEVYSLKGKIDTTMTGTISLSFTNRIKDIEYSLCKELDSIKNMKLFKIRIVNNSRYMKEYKITLDRAEQTYDLEEVPVVNQEEILTYFERYQKDSLKDSIQ